MVLCPSASELLPQKSFWSPDGTQIAFHSDRDGESYDWLHYEIYVMDIDGSNVCRLTTNNHFDAHPSW